MPRGGDLSQTPNPDPVAAQPQGARRVEPVGEALAVALSQKESNRRGPRDAVERNQAQKPDFDHEECLGNDKYRISGLG